MLSQGTMVRTVGLHDVQAKLIKAAPAILAENRAMATQMLETVKEEILPSTPLGPGRFGVHLRDSYRVDVSSSGVKTTGVLRAAVQGYWRERGTRRGEKATMVAHKALAGVRRFLNFYYGKGAQWWRL